MTFSHTNCVHPATSRDRSICRKANNNSGPKAAAFPKGDAPLKNEASQAMRDRIKANRNKPAKDYGSTCSCGNAAGFIQNDAAVCYTHVNQKLAYRILPL